jgi:phosphate uptake regulator
LPKLISRATSDRLNAAQLTAKPVCGLQSALLRNIHSAAKAISRAGAHGLNVAQSAAKLIYRAALNVFGFAEPPVQITGCATGELSAFAD